LRQKVALEGEKPVSLRWNIHVEGIAMINRMLLCLLVFGLLGCTSVPPTEPVTSSNQAALSDRDAHLVVAVQGELSVKREDWSSYASARLGTVLRNGDLLRLDGSAQATVVCADLTMVSVPGGVSGVPCKVARPVLTYGGSLVNPTRSIPDSDFPLIVTPRKTKLLNPHPTLRWTPVAGATSYQVSMRGQGMNWSTDVSSGTEIAYPGDAPALVAEAAYKVIVVAGTRSSEEETLPGLGFTLLEPDEATAVRDAEAKIRALGLPDEPTRLLLANLYAGQGLNAEAIEQLEALSTTTQEPTVLRSLGEVYLTIGLNRLAEKNYLLALNLSERANDVEGQALAQHMLGRIYEALGNADEAAQRLQKAKELYQPLGDTKTVRVIEQRLAGLPKP
jgi:hypothetical protein